jgi:signal transduction histidine kinase
MQEAVLNLLLNAMDAMPDGGKIEISTTRTTLQGKPMLRVDMTDSGAGISPEDLPILFDPFFSTKTRGVGLGLSNVKRIVEAHGGSVVVDSLPGNGATFAILLPES